jgi:hypothetical protein
VCVRRLHTCVCAARTMKVVVPIGHTGQLAAPDRAEKVPSSHGEHVTAPGYLEKDLGTSEGWRGSGACGVYVSV